MDSSHELKYCHCKDRTASALFTRIDVMTAFSKPQMATRSFRPQHYEDFQRLRADTSVRHLHAYRASPGESAAEQVVARARMASAQDRLIVSAFRLVAMVGIRGLVRLRPQKLCHRANLRSAYVASDLRRQGLAKSPLRLVLAEALRRPGLGQITVSICAGTAAARQAFQSAGFKRWSASRHAAKVEGFHLDEEHYSLPLVRNLRHQIASFEHTSTGDNWRGD